METKALNFENTPLKYAGIIGTGGIGSGKFFELNGNDTLGREESRSGHFKDIKDYCKQHIILHYVKVLLGDFFTVSPVGKIGDDETGNVLFDEMGEVGFDLQYVQKANNVSTLFSFCFYYPDGSGGNLTTDNSASACVDAACVDQALHTIKTLGSAGIIMAAPEVPLEARYRLIELGKQHRLFCTGSFTSEEIVQAYSSGIIEKMDLVAINMDEAAALSALDLEQTDPSVIVSETIKKLQQKNKNILVSITGGKSGSWCWDGTAINHVIATDTAVKSTAGAGDAFFSGLICGIATGLSFFEAQQLATLVAGLSVASPHTINKEICRQSLYEVIQSSTSELSPKILSLLKR